jgi:hypothetical protein
MFKIIAESLPNRRNVCQRKKITAERFGKLAGLLRFIIEDLYFSKFVEFN